MIDILDDRGLKGTGKKLFEAILYSNPAQVMTILQSGVNPNTEDSNNYTPLHEAAMRGEVEISKLLIEAGAKINATTRIIKKTRARGFHDPATLFKDGADTPLHLAAESGKTDVVKLLIEAGADVNSKNVRGKTPLFSALSIGSAGVVELLLKLGADPSLPMKEKQLLPVHQAALNGHTEVVKLLSNNGVDVNALSKEGLCPLHYAIWDDNVDVVNTLLAAGADPNKAGHQGLRSLHIAVQRNTDVNTIRILLEAGANPNLLAYGLWSPLHIAVFKGNRKMTHLLIQAGVKNKRNFLGITPRMLAIIGRKKNILELFKQA